MNINRNFILLIFSSTILFGCSQPNNIVDFDPSNLPKPKITNLKIEDNKEVIKTEDKSFITDLIPLKDREEILSKFKFGKQDPFSEKGINESKILTDLKLTGFLNSQTKKYVFVIYQDKHGTISENSIGGLNTNFLPKGAEVLNIDITNKKLIIKFDNRDYIFKL